MTDITVELIDNKQDDLTVVNAARVSFDKESKEFTYREEVPKGSDEGLVNYLAAHDHWTPFSHVRETFTLPAKYFRGGLLPENYTGMVCKVDAESKNMIKVRHSLWGWAKLLISSKVVDPASTLIGNMLVDRYPVSARACGLLRKQAQLSAIDANVALVTEDTDPDYVDVTLRETVPIFVARQRFKHMVGFTYNEVSRRYVDDAPTFYVPDTWRSRPDGSVKQGSGDDFTGYFWTEEEACVDRTLEEVYEGHLDACLDFYTEMIEKGIAPELARIVLPQSMMTSYYVTGSLSAFARMVKQRKDPHAQKEIQDLANKVDNVISELHPNLWKESLGN